MLESVRLLCRQSGRCVMSDLSERSEAMLSRLLIQEGLGVGSGLSSVMVMIGFWRSSGLRLIVLMTTSLPRSGLFPAPSSSSSSSCRCFWSLRRAGMLFLLTISELESPLSERSSLKLSSSFSVSLARAELGLCGEASVPFRMRCSGDDLPDSSL